MRSIDAPVAVVDVFLKVAHVVVLKVQALLFLFVHVLILRLERFRVYAGASAQILFRVGEQVVRAGSRDEGPAHFRVRDGKRGLACGRRAAHELLKQFALFCRHGVAGGCLMSVKVRD